MADDFIGITIEEISFQPVDGPPDRVRGVLANSLRRFVAHDDERGLDDDGEVGGRKPLHLGEACF